MFHLVARSLGGEPLFRTWGEGRRLWDDVVRAAPDLAALVIMPNHLHLIHPHDVRRRLAAALSGFARRSNHADGRVGPRFEKIPRPQLLVDRQKVSRGIRYALLNPCRSSLAKDPLAWPLSTHRDACGLAVPSVVARVHDVERFH